MCGDVRKDSRSSTSTCYYWAGCGYFQGSYGQVTSDSGIIDRQKDMLGGASNLRLSGHEGGSGGTAGKGGNVVVDSGCKIYAFNGNRYTDGVSYNNGMNQTPIYCQLGVIPEKYSYLNTSTGTNIKVQKVKEKENVPVLAYSNPAYTASNKKLNTALNKYITSNVDMSKQGIGSGAGYIEVSNGTFRIK